jgi:histidine phosphotransfer protein HptB
LNDHHRIDRAAFAELQANAGEDFVAELVGTFAEEAPTLLAELRSALAAGHAERFRRAAHSLKSNSNTFGVRALAELARTLELGSLPADSAPLDVLEAEFAASLAALQILAREGTSG